MPTRFGSDGSLFDALSTQLADSNGVPLIETSTGIGSSPLGVSLREQIQFGLPNATFNLLPFDTTQPISENDNPLPYWQLQTTADITATAQYDSTTQTWGIKLDPGTAESGQVLTLKTRSWITTDDNLALRQKASLTLSKNGTYAGTTQYGVSLTAVYYDHTNAPISTAVIGTALDNATMTSISGFTTSGGVAIAASASWCELTIKLETTATVSSNTSVTLKSMLLATSSAVGGSFVVTDTFNASGTWTRPTGVNYVTVVGVGGGGGGAGGGVSSRNTNTAANSFGGASGASSSWAIIEGLYVGGTADATVTVGVGTAGTGGTAKTFSKAAGATTVNTGANEPSGNGGAGGATTFGTYLTIPGGGGGTSSSVTTSGGTAAGAPTSTIYGLSFLGAVAGTASAANGLAGSAAIYAQLPSWPAIKASGAAGSSSSATGASVNYAGTAGAAGTAGIIGSGGGGGRPEWNGTNFTAASVNGGVGGAGAGSGGASAGGQIAGTVTVTVTGGTGGSAAANAGAGGGGGGGVLVVATSTTTYNASTITATAAAGGNGAAGRIYVLYTA